MKIFLLLTIVFLCSVPLGATTLSFTVNSADTGIVYQSGQFDLHSSDFNGTVLSGQTLSIDTVFNNDVLTRVFALNPGRLGVLLIFQTTANGYPGFAGETTGFIRDEFGQQMGSIQTAGRAMGDNGTTSMGLVSFTRNDFGGSQVFDMSGVHFETSLPGTGYTITDARLRLSFDDNRIEFGTAQQLPEPSSLAQLTLGLTGILVAGSFRKPEGRERILPHA
jgi:hypothetical protein